MIARSSATEAKNTGILTFVGSAARLTMRTDTIASMTIANRNKFTPDITTTMNASGVITQP